jgi:hypothetical protein
MLLGIQSKITGSVTVEVFKGIGLHPKSKKRGSVRLT